jgi:Xaa-Pro aminopeptidase
MPLSQSEGTRRHTAIREALAGDDLDALIVLAPENFYYVTNFQLDVDTWERPVAAIIPREGTPKLVLNELSTTYFQLVCERGTCWVTDAEIYAEHPQVSRRGYLITEWDRMLAEVLADMGLDRGRLGFDRLGLLHPGVPGRLPRADLTEVPTLLQMMRSIKSDEEIALMQACGQATDWAQERFGAHVKPGTFIKSACLEVARLLGNHVVERYPDSEIRVMVEGSTGIASASPHHAGLGSGLRFAAGDNVVNFIAIRMDGYFVENERTYFVGTASQEQRSYFASMLAAHDAALAQMHEGRRICDIDSAGQEVFERMGYADLILHRSGHGMGIGGHEYPLDMSFNTRPLRRNMVISCEPSIYVYGLGGFRHSDSVVVGETQPVRLTNAPTDIDSLIAPVPGLWI